MRREVAPALCLFVLAVAPARAAAPEPSPSPLAPVTIPLASPTPARSEAGQPLKVIERLYVNSFCSRFVQHFNVAANVLVANDARLEQSSADLDRVEADYVKRDGALRVYDDRNRLIAEVGEMMRSIPIGQAAINDLIAQARSTRDPERKQQLTIAASEMQRSVDRQRAVSYDLSNVIHVLLDKHTIQDTAEYQIAQTMPYPNIPVIVTTLDDPVPEPHSTSAAEALAPKPATAKEVLQFDRERYIIAHAESRAAAAADLIVKSCVVEEHN
ncbi:MAG: hypothetical protein KGM44_08100 [bacterium]|nr:hypothetical protein [bacterium]